MGIKAPRILVWLLVLLIAVGGGCATLKFHLHPRSTTESSVTARPASSNQLWVPTLPSDLWSSLGPTSIVDGEIGLTGGRGGREVTGRVTTIKVHPDWKLKDFWLAGTTAGGIWGTDNGGRTWWPGALPDPSDGLYDPLALGIGAIAFSPDGCAAYAGTGDATGPVLRYRGSGLLVSDTPEQIGRRWDRLVAHLKQGDGKTVGFDWFRIAITGLAITGASCIKGDAPTHTGYTIWMTTRPASRSFFEQNLSDVEGIKSFLGVFYAHIAPGERTVTFVRVSSMEGVFTDLQAEPTDATCLYAAQIQHPGFNDYNFGAIFRSPSCSNPQAGPATVWTPVFLIGSDLKLQAATTNIRIAIANASIAYASISSGLRTVWRTDTIRSCSPCAWSKISFAQVSAENDSSNPVVYCQWDPSSPDPYGPDGCEFANVIAAHPSHPNTLIAGGVALWKCSPCNSPSPPWAEISYTTPRPRQRISDWDLRPWHFRAPRYASPRNGIHVDQLALAWAGERLVVGNDGGIWSARWPDPRDQPVWDNHNFGLGIAQIYRGAVDPRRPDVVFAGTQDAGTIRRDGWRWRWIQGGDGVGVIVSHKHPDLYWATVHHSVLVRAAEGNRLALWRTRDGGLTFQRADLGLEMSTDKRVPPFAQCPDHRRDVVLFGATSLWRSDDFFDIPTTRAFETASPPTWIRNYQPDGSPKPKITAIAFAPPSADRTLSRDLRCLTYAFGDEQGSIWLTRSGGGYIPPTPGGYRGLQRDAWTLEGAFDDRPIGALAIAPTPPLTVYSAISAYTDRGTKVRWPGYIYRKEGDGYWQDVTPKGWRQPDLRGTSPTVPIEQPVHALAIVSGAHVAAASDVVFAGGDFGVWMTYNGGAEWCRLRLDSHTPHPPVMDLKVHPITHAIYAFTFGRGVFRLKKVAHAVALCKDALGRPSQE